LKYFAIFNLDPRVRVGGQGNSEQFCFSMANTRPFTSSSKNNVKKSL
jgi:hypothetical protein